MHYVLLDCCPVPERLYPVLLTIKNEIGCTYQSCYRGVDARALLNQCGKHDQKWLFDNQGTAIQPNPANAPGHSTHELRNDGVAYAGWDGMPLLWWQCGLDIDDGHIQAFIAAARRHGWIATITYPGSSREYHHVNFRREPNYFASLKHGSRSPRVKLMTHRLGIARTPGVKHERYIDHSGMFFSAHVVAVVKHFQKDHHLVADGIVGPGTWKQINASARYWKTHAH